MCKTLIMAGVLLAALTANMALAQQNATPNPKTTKPAAVANATPAADNRVEDEKAIRDVAEAFIKTYNAKDAKSLAALFVANGEIVDVEGESFQGQDAIEQVFSRIFQLHPKSKIQVSIHSIRLLSPFVAMEDGTSTVTDETDQEIEHNCYTVVHVKHDGKWQMASARDLPDEAALADKEIQQLKLLIGDWVDESPNALVLTSYHWSDTHDYILSEFVVQVGNRPVMTGTQRIGWDPQAKKLHSWVFDSEGGFAEGVWTRKGNQWIVKMTGITADGKTASSTNITTWVSKDRLMWQSRDRIIGDEIMPDIKETPIVRVPPKPEMATSVNSKAVGESK